MTAYLVIARRAPARGRCAAHPDRPPRRPTGSRCRRSGPRSRPRSGSRRCCSACPLWAALAHQVLAMAVLTMATVHARLSRGTGRARPVAAAVPLRLRGAGRTGRLGFLRRRTVIGCSARSYCTQACQKLRDNSAQHSARGTIKTSQALCCTRCRRLRDVSRGGWSTARPDLALHAAGDRRGRRDPRPWGRPRPRRRGGAGGDGG